MKIGHKTKKDTIALKLPNTEVMPVVLSFAQTASSGDGKQQRAALRNVLYFLTSMAKIRLPKSDLGNFFIFEKKIPQEDHVEIG